MTVSSGYVSGVLAAVPGGAKYDVQYPASMDYMNGPIQGASDAMKYITQQNSRCPKQLYVLNGYSEGVSVVNEFFWFSFFFFMPGVLSIEINHPSEFYIFK